MTSPTASSSAASPPVNAHSAATAAAQPSERPVLPGILLAVAGLTALLGMTVYASSVRGILDNGHLMSDAWFQVTLLDAYLGFTLFWVWVCSQESRLLWRAVWFVAIMIFGNMATCLYVALWLSRRQAGAARAIA